jgi:hypothetical protein
MLLDLLKSLTGRKALLGVARASRPSQEEIARDANLVTKMAQTEGYQAWSEEVWATVAVDLQKAFDAKTDREATLHLGAVKGAFQLLAVAENARRERDRLVKAAQPVSSTSRR